MGETHILRWANGRFADEEWCDTNVGSIRAVESFFLRDGAVVAFDRHLDRFAAGLDAQGIDIDVESLRSGLREALPDEGEWFPRIEANDYGTGTTIRVLLRPSPVRETAVTVTTATHDPRRTPHIKGPDLELLGALRRASGDGIGEAIILDGSDVAEGAWSSVMWWDNSVLHRVSADVPRLASVTESVVLDHAKLVGTPVTEERRAVEDLEGCEVWVLSALHGIRVVTDWRGGPSLSIEPGRAEFWQRVYEAQRIRLKP